MGRLRPQVQYDSCLTWIRGALFCKVETFRQSSVHKWFPTCTLFLVGFSTVMDTFEVDIHSNVERQDISTEFDGQRHWSWAKWKRYIAPAIDAVPNGRTTSQLYPHRDILSRKTLKPKD